MPGCIAFYTTIKGYDWFVFLDCGKINQPYLEDGERIMMTYIAVLVTINFLLICLNEYGSYTRDKAVGRMMLALADATDRIEAKLEERTS